MKKVIVMAAAILFTAGISAFASGTNPIVTTVKEISYQVPFDKIVVEDDIDLVLQESTDKLLSISGDEADVQKLDWKIKKNVLYIKSSNGSLKNKVTVKISVNQLKEISIDGESALTSFGYLASPKLFVLVEGDSYVALKNAGTIYLKNGASTTFEVKKSVGKVVIGK